MIIMPRKIKKNRNISTDSPSVQEIPVKEQDTFYDEYGFSEEDYWFQHYLDNDKDILND